MNRVQISEMLYSIDTIVTCTEETRNIRDTELKSTFSIYLLDQYNRIAAYKYSSRSHGSLILCIAIHHFAIERHGRLL